jgi:hypothetical protein
MYGKTRGNEAAFSPITKALSKGGFLWGNVLHFLLKNAIIL